MAYHLSTPGIIAGNVFRTTITIQGSDITIDPTYVKNNTAWNGIKRLDLTIRVNTGQTVQASSTGVYALTISGFNAIREKITLINDGNIFGKGGAGGVRAANGGCQRTNPGAGGNGAVGGPALRLLSEVTLINSGVIGGGGGGGGGDGATRSTATESYSCQQTRYLGCNRRSNAIRCDRNRPGSCWRSEGRCLGGKSTNWRRYDDAYESYWTTCTRSYTRWCPNASGATGANGSGANGTNGTAYTTGAGSGATAGRGIVGTSRLVSGSIQGTVRGGTTA